MTSYTTLNNSFFSFRLLKFVSFSIPIALTNIAFSLLFKEYIKVTNSHNSWLGCEIIAIEKCKKRRKILKIYDRIKERSEKVIHLPAFFSGEGH